MNTFIKLIQKKASKTRSEVLKDQLLKNDIDLTNSFIPAPSAFQKILNQ
jgi:hypothetical protein